VNARTQEKKTLYKMRRITLNYVAANLDNFESIRHTILGADVKDVITVCSEKKIKRNMRKCDGNRLPGTDTVVMVSQSKNKMYIVLFLKRVGLDNLDSVSFGYAKDGQSRSTSLSVSQTCVKFASIKIKTIFCHVCIFLLCTTKRGLNNRQLRFMY
jgi:hypothetical protein